MGRKMRITCPNCQAQYDIDPAMIPEEGRDVQCSSCAHTWLEMGPHAPQDSVSASGFAAATQDASANTDAAETDTKTPAPEDVFVEETGETTTEATEDDGAGQEPVEQDAQAPIEDSDPADKLREAIDRPKSDPQDPEPEPEDFVSDMRDAVADPEGATDPSPDVQPDTGDEVIVAAEDVSEETQSEDVGAAEDDAQIGEAEDDVAPDEETHETGESVDDTSPDDGAEDVLGESDPEESDPEAVAAAEDMAAAEAEAPALDDEVADILREEAEREVTQRRSEEPPTLEAQAELGLGEEPPSEVLRERLDRMRGDGVPQTTVAQTLAAATATPLDGPRRERLPDIEEIKTTLRPGDMSGDDEPPIGPSEMNRIRQAGFRRGFATLVLAAGVLVAAYVFAPQIIDLIPGTEPMMMSYVDTANSVRDGIDRMMARAITGLNGLGGDA